mgnify:CR=1 FL=1
MGAGTIKHCKDCKHLERGLWVRFKKSFSQRKCLRTSGEAALPIILERMLIPSGCGPEARFFEGRKRGK